MTAQRLSRRSDPAMHTGIVHLGLGAFFRAFGCPIIAQAADGDDWGVTGVSLRSPDTRDALQDQGWAYTAVSKGPQGEHPTVIEVLRDVLVAPEDPAAVLRAMADPHVQIVTLTVTEKGYCHTPATGALDISHPDIVHDLAHALPKSAIGFLVRALAMRHAAGLAPFTVMSCDNLPQNGRLLRGVVLEFAALCDPALRDWIAAEGAFPSTMVDRITPATTADDITRLAQTTGRYDAAPVFHEPFAQWVIEDSFVASHPDFETAGAQVVPDVAAYEDMKLRMLNGTHSALAYCGYLSGFDTIAQTAADPVLAAFARGLWAEIIPAVAAPDGVDLDAYAVSLFDRYANPNIAHRTWQIAMDGSQKLPQRILGTLADAHAAGRDTPCLHMAVAAWMFYVRGVDAAGKPIDVRDPMADELRKCADASTPKDMVAAVLGVRAIFPVGLAPRLQDPVTRAAADIWENGIQSALERVVKP